jgi:hypothetical protein
MNTPGGAYNYQEQAAPIKLRFSRDFIDAYARLLAAQEGLTKLYNYTTPLPPLPAAENPGYQGIFDDALIWTRDAIRFLVGFSHLEQSITTSISVKTTMGAQAWQKALNAAGASDAAVFQFDVPESTFPPYRALRLRGISVYSVSKQELAPWRVMIQPPRKATIRFADDGTLQSVDQTDVPSVVSGRVMTRFGQRDADVVGLTSLRNISPISDATASSGDRQWIVTLAKQSLSGQDLTSLDDVNLDLHLATR